LCAKIRRNLT